MDTTGYKKQQHMMQVSCRFCVFIEVKEKQKKKKKKKRVSEVGFEPTPTRVDCDLNAAP